MFVHFSTTGLALQNLLNKSPQTVESEAAAAALKSTLFFRQHIFSTLTHINFNFISNSCHFSRIKPIEF